MEVTIDLDKIDIFKINHITYLAESYKALKSSYIGDINTLIKTHERDNSLYNAKCSIQFVHHVRVYILEALNCEIIPIEKTILEEMLKIVDDDMKFLYDTFGSTVAFTDSIAKFPYGYFEKTFDAKVALLPPYYPRTNPKDVYTSIFKTIIYTDRQAKAACVKY